MAQVPRRKPLLPEQSSCPMFLPRRTVSPENPHHAMRQMPNLSSDHHRLSPVPDPRIFLKSNVNGGIGLCCDSVGYGAIRIGSRVGRLWTITITNLDTTDRGLVRRLDPQRQWIELPSHEVPMAGRLDNGFMERASTRLYTMESRYIPM